MKKIQPLILFIVLYLLVWVGFTFLIHDPTSISPDTVENIMWGINPSLMYDKHPGLGALFLKLFLFVSSPLGANLIASSICVVATWIYIYKLSCLYFDIKESVFITILSALSFFYMGEFFLQYNQNIILLPFWSASGYYFVRSIEFNNTKDWILTSVALAVGVYAKFQIGLIGLAMLLYLVFNYDKKYRLNILIAIIFGTALLTPGFISLTNIDFSAITYLTARMNEQNNSIVYNFFAAIFDSSFQLLNFSVAIVVLMYLFLKKKLVRHRQDLPKVAKASIILGLFPYLIFCGLEMVKGILPTEWLVCTTVLVFPAIYTLIRVKLVNINLYKLVALGVIVNAIYFCIFNVVAFYSSIEGHNNIGNSVAVSADKFIEQNNLPYPQYASGYWKYGFYLTVFMKNKPHYIREWQSSKVNGTMVLVYPGCQSSLNVEAYGYKLIYKKCEEVKLVDKIPSQSNPFTFYLVKK
ncbi:hypothetical protein FRA_41c09950 [Francisella sp. W12-1067]|nr:hypothetical protein FRA_41c09950 [Francisella sp. W12-1067]